MTVRRLGALLALSILLLPALLAADGAPPQYPVTPFEEEAAKLLDEGRFTLAKEKARAILTVDKDSFVALIVLGTAYARSDGNLPKARFFLLKARGILERRWGTPMDPGAPWRWHARTLRELILVAGEMDDREEQLKLLKERDRLYTPKMPAAYGWPLMKLGRMEEGRKKLGEALEGKDPDARLTALNTLGAMENESGNREAAYGIFKTLVEEERRRGEPSDPVFLRNWANTALALHRYDEAEKIFLEATRHFSRGTFTNPWQDLAQLYLAEGRFPEALAAVREMQAWAHRNLPSLDQHSWAGRQTVVAALLAESGFVAEAEALALQVKDRPDRKGGSSGKQGQDEAGNLLFLQYILRLRGECLAEEASWAAAKEWPRLAWERAETAARGWAARERAGALTVQNGWLRQSLRPFCYDAVDVMVWNQPEFVRTVGAGVVGSEVNRILASRYPGKEGEEPFLRLLLGESLMRRGRSSARAQLEIAIRTLPSSEVLLRARAEALLGQACEEGGDFPAALRHYQGALSHHPGILRALGVALPVRVEVSGGPAAKAAGKSLRASPRFEERGAGFILSVRESGAGLTATLSAPDGSLLAQAGVPPLPDPAGAARLLCKEFHRRAFCARVDLAQTDIASLEGSNLAGQTVRDQLGDLLGPVKDKEGELTH